MLNCDDGKKGLISQKQFKDNLAKLNFSNEIMNQDDLQMFIDRYSQGNEIDYKRFVIELKEAQINLDDMYNNQQTGLDRLTSNVGEQLMINKMKEFDLKEQQNQELGL